eukprot:2234950-Prymnesium_polylepis.2
MLSGSLRIVVSRNPCRTGTVRTTIDASSATGECERQCATNHETVGGKRDIDRRSSRRGMAA